MTDEPMFDDISVPTVFFDAVTDGEARSGVSRMVAFQRRLNRETQRTERVPVAILVWPLENSPEIWAALKRTETVAIDTKPRPDLRSVN